MTVHATGVVIPLLALCISKKLARDLLRLLFPSVDLIGGESLFLDDSPSPKCFLRQEVMCNLSDLELLNPLQQFGH